MGAVLTDTEIKDLVTGTLKELGRLKFNQIAQRFQRYEIMKRVMRKDKVQFDSGNGIQRTIMLEQSGAARHVGMYQVDAANAADVLKTISVPWRHTNTNYVVERREIVMNGGASKIVDLLKVRRADAMLSLAELMESAFWTKPTDSSDGLTPYGVPYWIVKHASAGFNGGAPSGFTAGAGGLVHTRWQNYTGTYSTVSKSDLIASLRKAYRQIRFESPVDIPDYREGRGDQYRIYVNETLLEAMETLGEAQNENLGRDLASMDDTITFRRNPIVWVPYLDTDTTDPIYMLNFAWFFPVFLRGEFLREGEPATVANQHTVTKVEVDTSWNILCHDRRRHAVLYKV